MYYSSYLYGIDTKFICSQDSGNGRFLEAVKENDVTARRASYEQPADWSEATRIDAREGKRVGIRGEGQGEQGEAHYLLLCFSKVAMH